VNPVRAFAWLLRGVFPCLGAFTVVFRFCSYASFFLLVCRLTGFFSFFFLPGSPGSGVTPFNETGPLLLNSRHAVTARGSRDSRVLYPSFFFKFTSSFPPLPISLLNAAEVTSSPFAGGLKDAPFYRRCAVLRFSSPVTALRARVRRATGSHSARSGRGDNRCPVMVPDS